MARDRRRYKRNEDVFQMNVALAETGNQTPVNYTHVDDNDVVEEHQGESSAQPTTQSPSQRRTRLALRTWLRRLPAFSPSLVLENSGSVARDHLASERTFLAYVRTSLGCAATGVALVQLIAMTPTNVPKHLEKFGKVLGAVTEVLGAGIMVIAVTRYFAMQKALIDGKFPPAGVVVWTIVFAMIVITFITFGLMLAITLS